MVFCVVKDICLRNDYPCGIINYDFQNFIEKRKRQEARYGIEKLICFFCL